MLSLEEWTASIYRGLSLLYADLRPTCRHEADLTYIIWIASLVVSLHGGDLLTLLGGILLTLIHKYTWCNMPLRSSLISFDSLTRI